MCWTGRPMGDSWIYEFVKTPEGIAVDKIDSVGVMSLTDSLSRNDHVGAVSGILTPGDEGSFKPLLAVMQLDASEIRSCGNFMWIAKKEKKKILIPKGVIEIVAAKMVGVPRDKAGLKLCINTMKQTVKTDKMSMPNSMRLDCIVYGSAMAFVLTLKDEVAVFNQLCSPFYKKLYSKLSSVLSLEAAFAWCVPCGVQLNFDEYNATVDEYDRSRTSVPGAAFDAAKAWPKGLPGYESSKPLKPIRKGAVMAGGDRTMMEDKPQFHAVCTTFSNYIPLVPYASVNNETVSLANRALMQVPTTNAVVWREAKEYARREMALFESLEYDLERDFVEWNSKFDTNKQRKHNVAWESLKHDPLGKKDFVRSQFVKRELTMKGGEEPEEFDPRSIQANQDRLNVSLGPTIARASTELKNKWNVNHKICYTAGMTSEEIGLWRAQFADRPVTIIECDESRYDAHQGVEVYELTEELCRSFGMLPETDSYLALTSMKRIKGWSSHGIKYGVDFTMTSGSPTTSFANSFLNGSKTAYALERLGFSDFRMLVHGDDSLIVIEGHLNLLQKRMLTSGFMAIQASLGFTTKMKVEEEWALVEYCSSLFWPVQGGFVLGPKIGKRLPKIGFSLRKLDQGEVKGMLLGLSIEAGFVPVLRVYAKHQLALVRKVEKKEYVDRRSIYKSFATEKHVCDADTAYFFLVRYGFDMAFAEECLTKSLTGNLTDCIDLPIMPLFTTIDL